MANAPGRHCSIELERRKKEGNKAGKAQWVGYDEQGNGVVKKDGEEVKVKVIGGKSLSPGQSVYVDSQNTVQVRKKKGEEESPKRKKKIRSVKSKKSVRPLILEDEEEELTAVNYEVASVWVERDGVGFYRVYTSDKNYLTSFYVLLRQDQLRQAWTPAYDQINEFIALKWFDYVQSIISDNAGWSAELLSSIYRASYCYI